MAGNTPDGLPLEVRAAQRALAGKSPASAIPAAAAGGAEELPTSSRDLDRLVAGSMSGRREQRDRAISQQVVVTVDEDHLAAVGGVVPWEEEVLGNTKIYRILAIHTLHPQN